jgi:hypothetical protein
VTVTLDGKTVPATGHLSLRRPGKRILTVKAVNNVGLTTRTSKTILVVPADRATAPPSQGTHSITSARGNRLHDGRYSVVMNLLNGTPGASTASTRTTA